MKNAILFAGILAFSLCLSPQGFAQKKRGLGEWIKKAEDQLGSQSSSAGYTNQEAVSALREALEIGTKNAAGKLSGVNGYFGNPLVKILLPPEAQKVETALRGIGMGRYVDDAILSMNRAAEEASSRAVPLFVSAIKQMTVQDGLSIVRDGDGAATRYLEAKTSDQLSREFQPVIRKALSKVDATKYWRELFEVYNRLPTTREKINPDLDAYVTEKALDGLFLTIAQEENKIRKDPAAQVTGLLKKVFGRP